VARFTHMKESEAQVWERFLANLPWRAVAVRYDVRLGEGATLPADVPQWVRDMAWALSAKRVDAVVETADHVYLIEVKSRASLSAVGQLLGYELLYRRQYGSAKGITLVLVCESIAPDVEPVLERYGIELHVV